MQRQIKNWYQQRQLIESKQQIKTTDNTVNNLEQKIDYLMKGNEKAMEYVDNLTVLSKNASENMKNTYSTEKKMTT